MWFQDFLPVSLANIFCLPGAEGVSVGSVDGDRDGRLLGFPGGFPDGLVDEEDVPFDLEDFALLVFKDVPGTNVSSANASTSLVLTLDETSLLS